MIDIVVRSKRDADAVKAMVKTFYSSWDIGIHTLHGARRADEALKALSGVLTGERFYVILLGREDQKMAEELDRLLPPNAVAHVVPRARVRNTRIEHLAHEFDVARSRIRLAVSWSTRLRSYVLALRHGEPLEGYEYNPAYDVFIGTGFRRVIERLGCSICSNPLVLRKFAGVHDVYCGRRRVCTLKIPDEGSSPSIESCGLEEPEYRELSLSRLAEANREAIGLYAEIARRYLGKYRDWADTVVVPWSGGKDSTAALILALDVFPKKIVKAVYVDTGVEFPCTREYIAETARRLGIDLHVLHAGVDRGITEEGLPLPTHDNRWCTGRKIDALSRAVLELSSGNTLVITGDRDAESRARSIRPPSRRNGASIVISPLKNWSGAHVQVFLASRGIRLNPLYEEGFYRIGCYICPALRSWEINIMLSSPRIMASLQGLPLFKMFIEKRIGAGSRRGKNSFSPLP